MSIIYAFKIFKYTELQAYHNSAMTDTRHKETGAIRKDWRTRTSVALIFPNTYQVGMTNLGFHAVYRIINSRDDYVCERVFLPDSSDKKENRISSIESGAPLHNFDIAAFSISFENDYLNILEILKKSGIPLYADQRDRSHPLVAGGGVACFLNPEPLAPFFDLFFIGEGEFILPEFMDSFSPDAKRKDLLEKLASTVRGIYVPSLYDISYRHNGKIDSVKNHSGAPEKIQRIYTPDISDFDTSSVISTPETAFGDTFLTEISRGCPHGCRFCSAGYIYRPPRFRNISAISDTIKKGAESSSRIGLVGAAITDHPDINRICRLSRESGMEITFSSIRADGVTPELIEVIAESGARSITVAPDAGSERLRRVINKRLREEEILNAVGVAVNSGIQNIKLYYMIGLPTETDNDIEEIISLTKRIKSVFLEKSRPKGKMGDITVGLSSFVPKPATPFQWEEMQKPSVLKKKIARIHKETGKIPNVHVHADPPKWSYIQAVFARGDRRAARLLENGLNNNGNWPKTFRESPTDADLMALAKREKDEILAWDIIESRVPKDYLWNEYQKALGEQETLPCPASSGCTRCGVCGAEKNKPD